MVIETLYCRQSEIGRPVDAMRASAGGWRDRRLAELSYLKFRHLPFRSVSLPRGFQKSVALVAARGAIMES